MKTISYKKLLKKIKPILLFFMLFLTSCQTSKEDSPSITAPYSKQDNSLISKLEQPIFVAPPEFFKKAQPLFKSLNLKGKQDISWQDLKTEVLLQGKRRGFFSSNIQAAIKWINYVKENNRKLKEKYHFSFERLNDADKTSKARIRFSGELITKEMWAMWRHLVIYYSKKQTNFKAVVSSGYRSPAYQLYIFTRSPGKFGEIIKSKAFPFYSRHQLPNPDISVSLIPVKKEKKVTDKDWADFLNLAKSFGFSQSYPENEKLKGELTFFDLYLAYDLILAKNRVPSTERPLFITAIRNSSFYPSPRGFEFIIALAVKESSFKWNPKLNNLKKRLLKKKFDSILSKTDHGLGGIFSSFLLSKEDSSRKKALTESFNQLMDKKNHTATEYDFYIWSRDCYSLFQDILRNNRNMARFGQWFFNLEKLIKRMRYEPQTFGLWQINVNQLKEKLERNPKLRFKYPYLFSLKLNKWQVNRHYLIQVLSGVPEAPLGRSKALELIFNSYLQPRYLNHLRGSSLDMEFFAAENLAGEMSTYRAAIQERLNQRLGVNLVLDGDLSYYYPYSVKINWEKLSNSQSEMLRFIRGYQWKFKKPVNPKKLLKQLCDAQNREQMEKSELYQKIMGIYQGKRIFPKIRSDLYKQSPKDYAKKVTSMLN